MMGYQEAAVRLLWAWDQSLDNSLHAARGVKRVLRRLAKDWARPGQEDDLLWSLAGKLEVDLKETELDDVCAEAEALVRMAREGREDEALEAVMLRLKGIKDLHASGDMTQDDALHASYVLGVARGEINQIREKTL